MLQSSTVRFLKDLKKNNNKAWFDANRKVYEEAKADFIGFIQRVIDGHAKNDTTIRNITAKDCLFRINRDIRFSNDKSPYKSNFGASINPDGRKSMSAAGYYFHLEPGASFTGGGLYGPLPEVLQKLRQEIDYNFEDFKKIIQGKKFKSVYNGLDQSPGMALSRVPKGYEADNPAAEFLKYKSYIAMIELKDTELTSKDLVKNTISAFAALQPLVEFINKAVK
jgi:uncharacterized protein (TIGR02453 family)